VSRGYIVRAAYVPYEPHNTYACEWQVLFQDTERFNWWRLIRSFNTEAEATAFAESLNKQALENAQP
jgi:hypothetical protein